jgi:hypothetical protein
MDDQRVFAQAKPRGNCRGVGTVADLRGCPPDRAECLQQLLLAYVDIVDRDDIHQAAERLVRVQQWIRGEAARAAADPVFAQLRAI